MNVTWCGRPCRHLLRGWLAAARRVAATVYGAGAASRAVLVNYVGAYRIDVLEAADGVFSEDYLQGDSPKTLSYYLLSSVFVHISLPSPLPPSPSTNIHIR